MTVKKSFIYILIIIGIVTLALTRESLTNPAQQQEQEIPRPAYQVEVVVTNVDVIVTDKEGKRVTGLKPENFKIYEDGLLQNSRQCR